MSARIACEQCGASVEYRPGADVTLVCPNCGHVQAIAPTAAAASDDYGALLAASLAVVPVEDQAVLTCGTCGARTTVPATVLAERCPFCGTPTVAPTTDKLRRASSILPFRLDEAAARAAVVAWERGLWFRPGRLAPAGDAWKLTAVYLPYWSFDWEVTTTYEGACGRTSDNKTTWTDVRGVVRTSVTGSTVLGSHGVDRQQGAELEPWDTEAVVGFKDEYLQGVRAEQSALTIAEAGDLAHRLLDRNIVFDIERDIGGDRQRIDERKSRYDKAAVRLVLMPIWITHFEHGGRRYQVLVNARTGEVIGDRPVSRTKVWTAGLAPLALAVAGGVFLPSALHWERAGQWRGHLLAFWAVLLAVGLLGVLVGGLMTGRARAREPARHRDLYVARKGGSGSLQIDPAAMWRGALQADGVGRATLVMMTGFAFAFVALMPAAVLLIFSDSMMAIVMMHAFSAFAVVAFVLAFGRAGRDRRKLLGLDER